ncbi:MAG TPA: hypothetical protein VHA52_05610 [Candidatus Babeliaceae bacterium]|jgi:hypothetical protein|nr:hypothetical protein [Candidatus Babeliaceae bacterium]
MADDKKNPKEASNIFHSIMKASVKPNSEKIVGECPRCKEVGIKVSESKQGRLLYITFQCRNGHGEYTDTVTLL